MKKLLIIALLILAGSQLKAQTQHLSIQNLTDSIRKYDDIVMFYSGIDHIITDTISYKFFKVESYYQNRLNSLINIANYRQDSLNAVSKKAALELKYHIKLPPVIIINNK